MYVGLENLNTDTQIDCWKLSTSWTAVDTLFYSVLFFLSLLYTREGEDSEIEEGESVK